MPKETYTVEELLSRKHPPMNPDIVYIYSHEASKWRGRELLFSLRSLEKYGTGYNNVWLIGDKPAYINDKIKFIPTEENGNHPKERRLFDKLLTACNTEEITKNFVFFNDDFFLTKPIDFSSLPFYYSAEDFEEVLRRKKKNAYTYALQHTYILLAEKKRNRKFFDIHYPMTYNKEKFIKTVGKCDWNIRSGYVIKTLYANLNKIAGKKRKDCKIFDDRSVNSILKVAGSTDLFSTDQITHSMVKVLNHLYPGKSTFEK